MAARNFVLSDVKSSKFWSIELDGAAFTVRFGKVGTAGQQQRKEFADEALARKEHNKLVAEKTKKGYVEDAPATAPAKPAASLRDALEAAIIANPDDLAAHSAYADWLTEQTDRADAALGEFLQLQMALEDEKRPADERKALRRKANALLKKSQEAWAGEWAGMVPYSGPEGRGQHDFEEPRPVRFTRGLPSGAVIAEFNVESARAFVRSPQTRFLRELYVGGFATEDEDEIEPGPDTARTDEYDPPSEAVFHRWPHFGNLRVFQLGWTSDEIYDDFCHFQCHLDGARVHEIVRRMPLIEELYLFAHHVNCHKLFALPMPRLRVLQIYHSHDYPLAKLAKNASLGEVRELLFHPHAMEDEPAINLKDLRALVRSPHLGKLETLRLRLADFGDAGVEEIVKSGLLKRLKTLDLRHGCVTDVGARRLAADPAVRGLNIIDLSNNALTAEGIAALEATGVPSLTGFQHDGANDGEDGDMDGYLYQGDYE